MALVNTYSVDPAASLITRRPPLRDFFSQRAFAQIWKWIDECTKNHGSACLSETARPLPTKLIDVGTSSSEPSLFCPPPGQLGKYVALSCCWGSKPQKVLTTSQAKLNRVVFPLSPLSATVRDAIMICRFSKLSSYGSMHCGSSKIHPTQKIGPGNQPLWTKYTGMPSSPWPPLVHQMFRKAF
jgi:hypothetical protein